LTSSPPHSSISDTVKLQQHHLGGTVAPFKKRL
jgi:hypothetical protein